jgi:hypothetical protein
MLLGFKDEVYKVTDFSFSRAAYTLRLHVVGRSIRDGRVIEELAFAYDTLLLPTNVQLEEMTPLPSMKRRLEIA